MKEKEKRNSPVFNTLMLNSACLPPLFFLMQFEGTNTVVQVSHVVYEAMDTVVQVSHLIRIHAFSVPILYIPCTLIDALLHPPHESKRLYTFPRQEFILYVTAAMRSAFCLPPCHFSTNKNIFSFTLLSSTKDYSMYNPLILKQNQS